MISLFVLLLTLLMSGIILIRTRENFVTVDNRNNRKINTLGWLTKPIIIASIGIVAALVQPFVLERVNAGSVGLCVNLSGDERGLSSYKFQSGWNVYNTWSQQLVEIPTSQYHMTCDMNTVTMKGGFTANIKPTFNYQLIPTGAGDMYINLRNMIPGGGGDTALKQVEKYWLLTAIVSSMNDVSNRWVIDSVLNNRELYENDIIAECNKRIGKWFNVSQLRSNIVPPPALQQSIIAKTVAIKDAQAEEEKAKTVASTTKRKLAEARGDSAYNAILANGKGNAKLIEAEYEARSMKEKQKNLNPIYLEYLKINTWDGKNPTTILGSGTGTTVMLGK